MKEMPTYLCGGVPPTYMAVSHITYMAVSHITYMAVSHITYVDVSIALYGCPP